jgi:L-rhamnose isomerase
MDFFQFLSQLFNKIDNVAILVLVAVCGCLMWLHVQWRKEEREDRRQLLDLVQKNTDALNGVKLALAVMTGKNV